MEKPDAEHLAETILVMGRSYMAINTALAIAVLKKINDLSKLSDSQKKLLIAACEVGSETFRQLKGGPESISEQSSQTYESVIDFIKKFN